MREETFCSAAARLALRCGGVGGGADILSGGGGAGVRVQALQAGRHAAGAELCEMEKTDSGCK